MKAKVIALLALCFVLFGVNDAEAGGNKKGKGVATTLVPTPVDGECGSNSRSYRESDTAFSGSFCKAGEPSQTSIAFPEQGRDTLWTCPGQKGGKPAVCPASREKKQVVVEKEVLTKKVCVLVPVLLGVTNIPASTVSISGRLSDVCGVQQWLPGLQVTSGGGTAQTVGYQQHCEVVVVE